MANWTKLSGGAWGVQTRAGTTGDRITVTKANGQTASVTLGAFVKRTRWGTVFAVAGRKAPARTSRPRRRAARVTQAAPTPVFVAALKAAVATPEPFDASVARFRLLILDDSVSTIVDADNGPGRLLQID